jgi:predicted O-linked N-acetylglucosamine transferase (SPINDLY family)
VIESNDLLQRAYRLSRIGDLAGSKAACRRAIDLDGQNDDAISHLLVLSLYDEDLTSAQRAAAHRDWGALHPNRPPGFQNIPNPGRALVVGYVRRSILKPPGGSFLRPILEHHSAGEFSIFCYSGTPGEFLAPHTWRDISMLDAEELHRRILEDRVDILINLDGHFDPQSMKVFAWGAAPVQISFANYATTTGLRSIRYRITDEFADPPGLSETLYTEQLYRLPAFLPFAQPRFTPEIGPPPRLTNGFFTFGCFNNPLKIGRRLLTAWGNILRRRPDARLILHHPWFYETDGAGRSVLNEEASRRVVTPLVEAGVHSERIALVGPLAHWDHLDLHNEVDLMLDCHPYTGVTTTLESLWMGVPCVTIEGDSFLTRTSSAVLRHVGCQHFIAEDWPQYEAVAVGAVASPAILASERATVRSRLAESPLMDAASYVRELERAYRACWQDWVLSERGR